MLSSREEGLGVGLTIFDIGAGYNGIKVIKNIDMLEHL